MPAGNNEQPDNNGFDGPTVPRRDRPWLMPTNRKLRHLQGISLRNLTLTSQSARPRGKTIDDESLPQTWKSPAKLLAQRGNRDLGHSKSSSDLSGQARKSAPQGVGPENVEDAKPKERPSVARGRRRSTLSWVEGSYEGKQRNLEDVIGDRMADTWFSIHCEAQAEPVYVSEVLPKAMNPSFRFFDLKEYGPSVTRLDSMTIRLWAKSARMEDYELLLELQLHMRSLQFLGKSLENCRQPLPPNCVIFHLADGVYANLTVLPSYEPLSLSSRATNASGNGEVQPTSSYDALMRLSILDDCIQDALATRSTLAEQIDSLIAANRSSLDKAPEASQAQESLASTKRALAVERKRLKLALKNCGDLRASIDARRAAMAEGGRAQGRAEDYLSDADSKLTKCGRLVQTNKDELRGQQRRIVEDLMRIYPIEPIPKRPLHFTIASLPLSNSSFSDPSATSSDESSIAAALGYVAHVIYLLSFYLSVPLPYPVQPHSSTSTIHDPISLLPNAPTTSSLTSIPTPKSSASSMPSNRIFPLFPGRSSVPYRFEYGVFLLNKDLERLMAAKNLKALDLRQTLPNLKYLLEVMRGDEGGVVPERKRGVFVRALTGLSGGISLNEDSGGSEAASPGLTMDGPGAPGWNWSNGAVKSAKQNISKKMANEGPTEPTDPAETKPGILSSRSHSHSHGSSEAPGDKARQLVEEDAEGLLGRLKRQAVS